MHLIFLDKIKRMLLFYKKHLALRVIVNLLAATLFSIFFSLQLHSFFIVFFVLAVFDYMTLDMIFVRDFYPANLFAERIFVDKNSIGNKAIYLIVYLLYSAIAMIGLWDLVSKK